MSKLNKFIINSGTMHHDVMVTTIKTNHDSNGNPQYLLQVWVLNDGGMSGHIWYPHIKGFRDRADQCYKLQSYDIDTDIIRFIAQFEKHLQEVHA